LCGCKHVVPFSKGRVQIASYRWLKVTRIIFRYTKHKVTDAQRNYIKNSFTIHIVHSLLLVIRSRFLRWAGHIACKGEIINGGKIVVGKSQQKTL
jgi:hypothetical protein